jgi:hypothetical protein
MRNFILFVIILVLSFRQITALAQVLPPEFQLSDSLESGEWYYQATVETEYNPLNSPYTLTVKNFSQYMQSTRIVFELQNNTQDQLNHCWLHVALRDRQGMFLYAEQPLYFSNTAPNGKSLIDMYFESVGKEEIGFIVLYPGLLEANRKEMLFETSKIRIVMPEGENEVNIGFYSEFQ